MKKMENSGHQIELTRQRNDIEDMDEVLRQLHELGYILAIDDFSMGSTSIKYLKKNYFDIIKPDGNLVKNIFGPGNEREILKEYFYSPAVSIKCLGDALRQFKRKQE